MAEDSKAPETLVKGKHNAATIDTLVAIWEVLAKHSDRNHPLTAQQIIQRIESDGITGGGTLPDPKTVDKRLPEMMEMLDSMFPGFRTRVKLAELREACLRDGKLHLVLEDGSGKPLAEGEVAAAPGRGIDKTPHCNTVSNLLQEMSSRADVLEQSDRARAMPLRVRCVMAGKGGGYVEYRENRGKRNNVPRRYYLESVMNPVQWRMLTDMVKVYPYISDGQTKEMLRAIRELNPGADEVGERYPYKHENSGLFENLRLLDLAIRQCQRITVTYGEYVLDGRGVPRLRQRPREHAGLLAGFEPYALLWSNGYYYLVGQDPDKYGKMNLRVDRILKVTPLPKDHFTPPSDFDPVAYRDQSPVMYPGEPATVRMRCPAKLVSVVMDFFGTKAKFSQVDSDTVEAELSVAPKGTALFFMQYADQVEVLEPESLRAEVKTRLAAALKKYE